MRPLVASMPVPAPARIDPTDTSDEPPQSSVLPY
jgi:hypothetical protein